MNKLFSFLKITEDFLSRFYFLNNAFEPTYLIKVLLNVSLLNGLALFLVPQMQLFV